MQILKFGGTSVGSPVRIQEVANLINDGQKKIVVLSAVAGTTNKLVDLAALLKKGDQETAGIRLQALRNEYAAFIDGLFKGEQWRDEARKAIAPYFHELQSCFEKQLTAIEEKIILAQGELISTHLFQLHLQSRGLSSILLPALEFIRTNKNGDPDVAFIEKHLQKLLQKHPGKLYYITQGYICRNAKEEVDNLKRGGSDYTATIIGAAIQAEEIQIWTDIDGLHNNDPRIVEKTFPVRQLSYREAAELAYFGAKILHPTCVIPAEKRQVPIRLKNTFQPEAAGTLISGKTSGAAISAIAAKDGIIAIKIRSGRMLNAYGFLRRVFEVFEQYKTPIDMITTSEVAVSLTIDDPSYLEEILTELKKFGDVSHDLDQTIICIVGDSLNDRSGYAKMIFSALEEVPIRMVSYGGSVNNVSILVAGEFKVKALQSLNTKLFNNSTHSQPS